MPSPQDPLLADFSGLGASFAGELHHLHALCFTEDEVWTEGAFQTAMEEASHWGVVQLSSEKAVLGLCLMRTIADACELLTIAVHPEQRGNGLAADMISNVTEKAAETGLIAIHLEVASDNPGAIRLYESSGFQRVGQRPKYYRRTGDLRVDAILMTKTP